MNKYCYRFWQSLRDQVNAQVLCGAELGGDLASINDADELAYIRFATSHLLHKLVVPQRVKLQQASVMLHYTCTTFHTFLPFRN